MHEPVRIQIVQGNALEHDCDVLALKYARALYGVAGAAAVRLSAVGVQLSPMPEPGESLIVKSQGSLGARQVLFLGVESLGRFGYDEIREFARAVLAETARLVPGATTVALTLHGMGYGLEGMKAFRSEVAGLFDGLSAGTFPPKLKTIAIVEREPAMVSALCGVALN